MIYELAFGRIGRSRLFIATVGVVLFVVWFARGALFAADPVNGGYLVGELRVKFRPADEAPDLNPKAVLERVGVDLQFVRNYSEQANIEGNLIRPALLAESSSLVPGRWVDIVVPFATETFWAEILKGQEGVVEVVRKTVPATRGTNPQVPVLSLQQAVIDAASAPTLEFAITSGNLAALDQFWATSFRTIYGNQEVQPMMPLGPASLPRPQIFKIQPLWQKMFAAPPWQSLRVTMQTLAAQPSGVMVKISFVGAGAYSAAGSPPPERRYLPFVSGDNTYVPFQDHISALGAQLKAALGTAGYTVQ